MSSEGGTNFAQFKVSMHLDFQCENFTTIFLISCSVDLRRQKTEQPLSMCTFLKCKKRRARGAMQKKEVKQHPRLLA